MVMVKQAFNYLSDGSVDFESWLRVIQQQHPHLPTIDLIQQATLLAKNSSEGLTTFYGQPCLEQGMEMAEILLEMKLDQDAVAAAIIASALQHTSLSLDTVRAQLNESVAKLAQGVLQMNVLNNLQSEQKFRDKTQLDRLRKIFLAMVSDIRVALIKLAERMCLMRGIKKINLAERHRIAQETMDIYAPLANRLGIGQLKWELEDTAFHYTHLEAYKTIANFIAERRMDREQRIHAMVQRLKEALLQLHIKAKISGRAKHIYSIYLKAQKKHLDYQHIYDYSAIRILVPKLEDCYTTLSLIHSLFEHIPAEFDDYISHPKPNGYRSIHTAVIGPDQKNFEIQIRTIAMHEQAEHGVAAHWLYKEHKTPAAGYEAKITFLRQLLAWHKDIAQQDQAHSQGKNITEVAEDTVYVLTPAGDVIDLPMGATPLDFAYHIHSELGHRCRGAKIKGHIVPLTYQLRTGDQVEIITTPHGTPSRDWLNKTFAYLQSARARAKVAHWFKQQDIEQYIQSGQQNLERELARVGIHQPNFEKIAARFQYKTDSAMFAAIGHGNLRIAQIIHALQTDHPVAPATKTTLSAPLKPEATNQDGLQIAGIHTLLTRIARCCKPIPGDRIIGYITQGRGVSIHREDCSNILSSQTQQDHRLIQVSWDSKKANNYYVDLKIRTNEQDDLLKEVTSLLANAKIKLVSLNSSTHKKNNILIFILTIQLCSLVELKQIMSQINQLPNVIDVKRVNK